MSASQPEEPPKEKTREDNKFEGQAKESEQGDVKIGDDQRLQLLPENEEEEKEEILLTAQTVNATKPKFLPSAAKPSRMRRRDKISSSGVKKQLERQRNQIDKIRLLVQSIRNDTKSIQEQPKLIKQVQSQIKQLQNQIAQIQKIMTKKNFAPASTLLRKKR